MGGDVSEVLPYTIVRDMVYVGTVSTTTTTTSTTSSSF